ncbi:N-hydroxyarylamine O-acetyltransferase [compost metagenome]
MQVLSLKQTQLYLKRLGIEEMGRPTSDFLFALHRAHVEKVAWQTIDLFAGKPVPIDYPHSLNHIMHNGGGYCFHLNGAFSVLLRSLGYDVSLHRAGVQPHGRAPKIDSFHVGLTVKISDDNQQEHTWLVDVGLGDMPYEPIPLIPGEYRQGAHLYKLVQSGAAANGWRLEHDPRGAFIGVDFAAETVNNIAVFKPKHEHLSSSPDSTWVNLLLVQNRHKSGNNELRGCIFSQYEEQGTTKSEIPSRNTWFDILSEVFGEPLNHFTKLEKDDLWVKVLKTHEEWKRKQCS